MEIDPEELVIKQEIKEEEGVSFKLIEEQRYSPELVKDESVCSEIKEEESFPDMTDSKTCFVADDVKEEKEIKQEDVSIMEIDPEELVIKQEIKEEEEVSFKLIKEQRYSPELVKDESVCSEIKEEESFLDMTDSKTCFVADDVKEEKEIKQEDVGDSEMNDNMYFEETCVGSV